MMELELLECSVKRSRVITDIAIKFFGSKMFQVEVIGIVRTPQEVRKNSLDSSSVPSSFFNRITLPLDQIFGLGPSPRFSKIFSTSYSTCPSTSTGSVYKTLMWDCIMMRIHLTDINHRMY